MAFTLFLLFLITQSFECFFRPISQCTYHDALTAHASQGGSQVEFLLPSQVATAHLDTRRVVLTTGEAYKVNNFGMTKKICAVCI